MEQDAGHSELDDKRKAAGTYTARPESPDDEASWERVAPPFVAEDTLASLAVEQPSQTKPKPEPETTKQMVIEIPRKKIHEVSVMSFAAATPENLDGMKLRELQGVCEDWGIQTSGSKGEVRERLRLLFSGQPVLQKSCTTRYVQLMETRAVAAAAGYPADKKAEKIDSTAGAKSEDSKASCIFRSSGKMASKENDDSKTAGSASRFQKGSRPTPEERHPGIACDPNTGKTFDPKTGLEVPKELAVGTVSTEVRCGVCGRAMCLRRGFNLFFGCSSYPGCQFTRPLDEGLAMRRARRET